MAEQNHIVEPLKNNQNPNENVDLVNQNSDSINNESLKIKLKKYKIIYCILMAILIIVEFVLEFECFINYDEESSNFMSYLLFFFVTPFSLLFSMLLYFSFCDSYSLNQIFVLSIFKEAIVIFYIIFIRCSIIFIIFLIIVTIGFCTIAFIFKSIQMKSKIFEKAI